VVGGPERPGGGRVAGQDPVQLGARAGALSHDFLLTTPYHSLRIDSIAQVITVALLFGTGLVASLAGRARRRQTVAAEAEAPVDADNLTQLDAEDHILDGRLRPAKGPVVRWVRPSQGAVLQLVQHRQPVGVSSSPSVRASGSGRSSGSPGHRRPCHATATGPAVSHDQ
jgi:hypothetical protein